MKYLFVLSFVIVFIFFDKSVGCTDTSPLWKHFTYMFQHAGVVHLIINSLAFIGMFRVLERVVNKYVLALSVLEIGFFASFLSSHEIPTVGISGAVYAMAGIYLALIGSKKLIVKDRNKLYIYLFSINLCLTVSFFNPHSNFRLHVFSLIFGFIFWFPVELYKNSKQNTV